MATNKVASKPAFIEYGNAKYQEAFKADTRKNIIKMGFPNKDELDGVLAATTLDMSNTLAVMPECISNYMHDEKRAFDLPAPDKKTAPATIKVVAVPKKTKTGTVQMGPNKGGTYTSTIAAHEEVKVKSRNKDFKSSK